MKKLITVTALVRLGLCPDRPCSANRHGEAWNDERRQARWFDGHHRHERNQGQYQKGQGRCTGPEGREEVSRSLTRRAHQAICR
jgi:hypothetical protein